MGVLEDLATYLDANLASHTASVDLFANDMPDLATPITCLYETPGEPPIETGGGDGQPVIQIPHVQVIARAATSPLAKQRARDVYRQLVLIVNMTLSGTYYLRCVPMQEPFLLRRDANERIEFAFNNAVHRGPES